MNPRPRRSLLNPELQRPSALKSVPRRSDQIWLDKNENLDPEMMELEARVLASIPREVIATYPEAGELYRRLSQWLGVVPESLLLTPGSDGAIRLTFEAFVEHGDGVVHTFPTFAMYPVYSQMFGAQTRVIDYVATTAGPSLSVTAILEAVRHGRPKLLCLPNPDSPTGTVLDPDALKQILGACEEVGTVLLIDEAYHPFHEPSVVPWTQQSQNLIVARTFAKAWGSAGLRIGYAVGHPATIALLHKMRPMYEAGSLPVEFMCRMLDHVDAMRRSVTRIIDGKRGFESRMRSLGFGVLPTAGNFTHIAFGARGNRVHDALAGKVLYRVAFHEACLAGYSRFSVAPEPIMSSVADMIQRAVETVP